jgi:hypothetical protein
MLANYVMIAEKLFTVICSISANGLQIGGRFNAANVLLVAVAV